MMLIPEAWQNDALMAQVSSRKGRGHWQIGCHWCTLLLAPGAQGHLEPLDTSKSCSGWGWLQRSL